MSTKGLVFVGETNAITLNATAFELCNSILKGNTTAAACRRVLFDAIFDSGPEFYWKNNPIQPMHEFKKIVNKNWIPFCKDVIDWIMIAGIVPIAFEKLKDGNLVPIVPRGRLGSDFDIQIITKGGMPSFRFVKLKSRKTGMKVTPRVDTKVFVRGGFGWDPLPNTGQLTSIVSSLITPDYFLNMITQYTLRAEYNRSDPEILTETTKESFGIRNEDDEYDYFGDWDKNKYKEEAKYRLNKQEILAVIEHQRMMNENAPVPILNAMGEPVIDRYKKQTHDNLHPLPINHKLARQNMPESRSDWVTLNRHNESVICAGLGVPRSFLISDEGMSETSVRLTQTTFTRTVNTWKNILSDILTDVYNSVYRDEDCKTAMCTYTQVELSSMSEEELFNKQRDPRVTVGFPLNPNDTDDGLLRKYALGVINWKIYKQFSLMIGGYPMNIINPSGVDESENDPWSQEYKLNMIRTSDGDALSKLGAAGTVVFPQLQPLGQEKEEKGKKDEKKKKKEKKEAPKRKPDEEEDSAEKDEKAAKKEKKKQKVSMK